MTGGVYFAGMELAQGNGMGKLLPPPPSRAEAEWNAVCEQLAELLAITNMEELIAI